MKSRVLLSLLLFLVGIQTPWAAGPSLPLLLSGGASQQNERSIETVPDPVALRADWWLFFSVNNADLKDRAEKLSSLLRRRYSASRHPLEGERLAWMRRVDVNLDAYVAARSVEEATSPAIPDVSEIYTPGQALELVSSLRRARVVLAFDVNDVAALQEAVEGSQREIDAAMAGYLQQDVSDPERLRSGFQIITDRLALATREVQLKLRGSALQARQVQVEALMSVEQRAEQRLRGDPKEVQRLFKEARLIKQAVEAASETLSTEKRRMLQSTADTFEDQLGARFREQRVSRGAIELLSHQLDFQRTSLQITLNNLLLNDVTTPLSVGREEVESTRQLIEQSRSEAQKLASASERERDRAGERLADTGRLNAEDLALNQQRMRLAQDSVSQVRLLNDQLIQLEFLSRWTATAVRANEGLVERLLGQVSVAGSRIGQSIGSVTDQSLFRLGETPITLSGLFKVIVIVIIAWMISWLFRRMIGQLGHRFPKENQSVLFVISRLAHYLIITIGVFAGLSSIGLSFANFALVAGALALGLGFGLQSIVNNFLSGLILFFERTVKVGDFVELDNGERGEVRSINVRGTIVNTNDNVDVIVPNSQFTERKVINWTLLDPFRRIHVPFRVAYESNEDKVVEAGLDAAHRLSSTLTGVLGREPSVWLVNYGENGLDFELIVWLMPDAVKRPDAVFAAYHWEIRKALRRHDVEVPVPQREIRFRQPIPLGLEESLPHKPQ